MSWSSSRPCCRVRCTRARSHWFGWRGTSAMAWQPSVVDFKKYGDLLSFLLGLVYNLYNQLIAIWIWYMDIYGLVWEWPNTPRMQLFKGREWGSQHEMFGTYPIIRQSRMGIWDMNTGNNLVKDSLYILRQYFKSLTINENPRLAMIKLQSIIWLWVWRDGSRPMILIQPARDGGFKLTKLDIYMYIITIGIGHKLHHIYPYLVILRAWASNLPDFGVNGRVPIHELLWDIFFVILRNGCLHGFVPCSYAQIHRLIIRFSMKW